MGALKSTLKNYAKSHISRKKMTVSSANDAIHNPIRTKMVCTIGPATKSPEMLRKLVEQGMNVARLNLSHCSHDFARSVINTIRQTNKHVAVLLDVNGPKIRTGRLQDGKEVQLVAGQKFFFVNDTDLIGNNERVGVTYTARVVEPGDKIFVDDGLLGFTVVSTSEKEIECIVDNPGILGENKGINLPGHVINKLPFVCKKDHEDILFAIEQNIDFLAISCVRDPKDVMEVRILLGNSGIKLLSKIENASGFQLFDSIVKVSDGIVLDRGYLGVEVDIERIAISQKNIISKTNALAKPVLISNEMLESMRENPRPTRAEAVDVANAVLDGADCLVLSGETALGQYPLGSLSMMRRICREAENSIDYDELQIRAIRRAQRPVLIEESIASSAVRCAREVNAKLILVHTDSTHTARLIAKYKPSVPVIAITEDERVARQLSISYGIMAVHADIASSTSVAKVALGMDFAIRSGLAEEAEPVVITSGYEEHEGATTEMRVDYCTMDKVKRNKLLNE